MWCRRIPCDRHASSQVYFQERRRRNPGAGPAHIIEAGIPTEALLAEIAVAKYADGQPLYRQEAIYARDKVLDRKLMAPLWASLASSWRSWPTTSSAKSRRPNGSLRTKPPCRRSLRLRIDEDGLLMGLCPR
ncbi:transposase [Bradyrhizobium sp. Ec3.3]|uniref:IS66 family transposase n=1 Tax=Bradyrhizobium sp. Ec3.3 TaxID=189753 RepID=UPI0035273D90